MLNARLVEPSALVSLARVKELHGSKALADGTLRLGAMTRHRELAEHISLAGPRGVLRAGGARDRQSDYPRHGDDRRLRRARRSGRGLSAGTVGIVGDDRNRRSGRHAPRAGRRYFLDWYTTALAPENWSRRSICRRPARAPAFITSSPGSPAISRSSALRCTARTERSGSRRDRRLRAPAVVASRSGRGTRTRQRRGGGRHAGGGRGSGRRQPRLGGTTGAVSFRACWRAPSPKRSAQERAS